MAPRVFSYSHIYNTIEKVEAYWNRFKPAIPAPGDYKEKWLSQKDILERLSWQTSAIVVLWDVPSNLFLLYADQRKVTGYESSLFTGSDGIDFAMSRHHPDYLTAGLIMNNRAIMYCIDHPEIQQNQITLNIETLFKRSDGRYFKALQQAIPVEVNEMGHPLLFLSYFHDISHLKKPGTDNFIITAPHEKQIWDYDFDKKCLKQVKSLSEQENKILRLLSSGKESKEIANELNISPHTVDTHRRNLLHKTNCIDTTALVTYAKMVGLI